MTDPVRTEQIRSAALAASLRPPDPTTRLGYQPDATPDTNDSDTPTEQHAGVRGQLRAHVGPWTRPDIIFAGAGVAVLAALFVVTLRGFGALTGQFDVLWTVAGIGAGASGIYLGWRTYPHTHKNPRRLLIGALLVAVAAFFTGIASNPIVVNGNVTATTSADAANIRYITTMRDNLYTLRALDAELGLPEAQAWAQASEYDKGKAEAGGLAVTYKNVLDGSGPPAGSLAEPTRHTLAAAYACAQAYDIQTRLLRNDDDKLRADLGKTRTVFSDELAAAGAGLKRSVADLGYNLELSKPAPTQQGSN